MTSSAVATFNVKNLTLGVPPGDTDVAIGTTLKKRFDDTTLSFSFTDASLKDPARGQGIVLGAERKLTDDIKANLAYDWHKKAATGAVTLNKSFDNGSSLELKATYLQATDSLVLNETWRLDANNKLVGSYNFKSEEAIFGYTYTKGDWAATGRYNFQKDSTVLEVEKKQGKAKLSAIYHPADGATALTWNQKPYKATLRANAGKGGVSAQGVVFAVTHEFEL